MELMVVVRLRVWRWQLTMMVLGMMMVMVAMLLSRMVRRGESEEVTGELEVARRHGRQGRDEWTDKCSASAQFVICPLRSRNL